MVLPVLGETDPVSPVPFVGEPAATGGAAPVLPVLLSPAAVSPVPESPAAPPESVIDVDCVVVLTELVVLELVLLPASAGCPVLVGGCAPTALSDVLASALA